MHLTRIYDIVGKLTTWTLIISDSEMKGLKLIEHDRWLIEECEKSPELSDKLLALGEIVRNLERVSVETR